jgi:ABC-type sugar transport system permease subunit
VRLAAAVVLASLLGFAGAAVCRLLVAWERRTANDALRHLLWLALTFMLSLPLILVAKGFDARVMAPFLSRQPLGLLDNPITLMPVISFVVVLKGVGLGMILFLTTIQQIPTSVYEAAEVDGASARQRAFLITLPLVRPIILFLSITGLMATLNAFTEVYAMTFDRGGPPTEFLGETVRSGKLTGYYLWTSFREQFYGRAAALSFILMAVALVVSGLNVAALRDREPA